MATGVLMIQILFHNLSNSVPSQVKICKKKFSTDISVAYMSEPKTPLWMVYEYA